MPGVTIKEFSVAQYLPENSNAVVGLIGPATKGPKDVLTTFTDEDNLIGFHGRPKPGMRAIKAGARYLRSGNQLKYVRVAGASLATAYYQFTTTVDSEEVPILKVEAISEGSWANGDLEVILVHNGAPAVSYDVRVKFRGTIVEDFRNLTNGTVETSINNNSRFVKVTLDLEAGSNFPDETRNSTTNLVFSVPLAEGDDGAFASTRKLSSTFGAGSRQAFGYTENFDASSTFTKTESRSIVPGTLVLSTTSGSENFTDNGDGTLTGDAGGSGYVHYGTGVWKVTFNATSSDITVSYDIGTYEIIGSTDSGKTSYTGVHGSPGVRPNTVWIVDNRDYQLDLGDGATAAYAATLGAKVLRKSVEVTATSVSGVTLKVTDDGEGNLVGDVASPGTINYTTGAISFTFDENVANSAKINVVFRIVITDDGSGVLSGADVSGSIVYETGAWALSYTLPAVSGDFIPDMREAGTFESAFRFVGVLGVGDGTEVTFTNTLPHFPVKKNTVKVFFANNPSSFLSDDGNGNLTGSGGSGTINYLTGAVTATMNSAVASSFAVHTLYSPIVLDFECKYPGDIGNERDTLTDGLFVQVDKSPSSPTDLTKVYYRVRVMFNNGTGGGPQVVETFDLLTSLDKIVEVVNDATNGSKFVTAELTNFKKDIDVTVDSNQGQKLGMSGAYTRADIIGNKVGSVSTGMQLYKNKELVPCHFLASPGEWSVSVQLAGISMAESRNLLWLFSMPDFLESQDAKNFTNGEYNASSVGGAAIPTADVPFPPLTAVNTSFAACYFSWVKYFDKYAEEEVFEGPEGEALFLFGRVASKFESWYPIAGTRRGLLNDVTELRHSPDEDERLLLYGRVGQRIEVINPVVDFVNQGIALFGQRTMLREEKPESRIHVRWTANIIANALDFIGRDFIFELNDQTLWREIRSRVKQIIKPIAVGRGLYHYEIICDATTNTTDVIREKKAICKIFLSFTEALENLEFHLVFTNPGADFSIAAPVG